MAAGFALAVLVVQEIFGVHAYIQDVRRRLGVTGFCWGGRTTWLFAAHNPKLKAGVAWYGRLVGIEADVFA